ncbi:hypothetical protein SOCE26_049850 [Sorangium cellulosum]|uniref:FHA domain-containing protein n=1 Tax=Sorangium cellulosum TaxID=56 RepID=A0A2L0EW92_SORCE|nr:FHA domain-containing protein [Sorangium cellulosum]AUX43535.1 hypothetical protein SOCE26_049850 [Sorangium cellulosum]
MGILKQLPIERRFTLGPRCLVGRHPACDLRFDDLRVSWEHAVLRWINGCWELRDLGSRNGTFVDGRRLKPGERVALATGEAVGLGGAASSFALVDGGGPAPGARHRSSGAYRCAADHVLVLPCEERPIVTVYEDCAGRWVAEHEERLDVVQDHDLVVVDGEPWVLELPTGLRATWEASAGLTIELVGLRIAASRDEEHVEVTVVHDAGAFQLSPRSYHYLLLVLARLVLEDTQASAAERGWVDRDALCRMLSIDALKLNLDVCRLRKQLGEAGVHGAAGIVERRPATGQLRLGISRVEVASL